MNYRLPLKKLTTMPLFRRERQAFMSNMTVFDREVKRAQKDNAAILENSKEYEYLRDEIADRLVDRIEDIRRDFPLALDLGCGSGHISKKLRQDPGFGGISTLIQCDYSHKMLTRDEVEHSNELKTIRLCVDEEFLPFPEKHFDLIMSSLSMHWINDLPGVLLQIQRSLKPDGVFLGAMLGGETLRELRSSFILAEQERLGGVSSHISPFASIPDIGGLLQGSGFALSTVDTDVVTVEYPNVFVLMKHLRGMGENLASIHRGRYTSRETLLAAASIYQEMYGNEDGSIPVTFQVMYMIGWAPHESQQKPKDRGSAQQSLKNLTTKEK